MGWTTTSDYERHGRGLFTIQEYLDQRFASDHPDFPHHEVLDSRLHGKTEYYAAIRSTPREGDDREMGKAVVFALIALVSYKPRDPEGQTLGWKEMSENSGPYCFNCPDRILSMLDETDNENALEWRATCHAHHVEKRKTGRAFENGAKVRFKMPFRFPGGIERREFTVEKHGRTLRFRAEDGTLCRIPKAKEQSFEVIDPRVDP